MGELNIIDQRSTEEKEIRYLVQGDAFIYDDQLYILTEDTDGIWGFCFEQLTQVEFFHPETIVTSVDIDIIIK